MKYGASPVPNLVKVINKVASVLETAPKQVKALHEKALQGDINAEHQVRQYLTGKAPQVEIDTTFDRHKFVRDNTVDLSTVHPSARNHQLLTNQTVVPQNADEQFGVTGGDPYSAKHSKGTQDFREYAPLSTSDSGYEELSYELPRSVINKPYRGLKDHFDNLAGTHVRRDWYSPDTPDGTLRVIEIQSDVVNKAQVKKGLLKNPTHISELIRDKDPSVSYEDALAAELYGMQLKGKGGKSERWSPQMQALVPTRGKELYETIVNSPKYKEALKKAEPFKYNIKWATDTVNRQFKDAADSQYTNVDFLISDPVVDETRSEGVKKWYANEYKGIIKKQAKKIGAKVEEYVKQGPSEEANALDAFQHGGDPTDFASYLLDLPTNNPLLQDLKTQGAKKLGKAPEDINLYADLPDLVTAVGYDLDSSKYNTSKYLRVVLPTGAAALASIPAYAKEQGEAPMDPAITTKAQDALSKGVSPKTLQEALAKKYTPQQVRTTMLEVLKPKIEDLKARGVPQDKILEALQLSASSPTSVGPDSSPLPPSSDGQVPQNLTPETQAQPGAAPDPLKENLALTPPPNVAGFGKAVGLSADNPDVTLSDGRSLTSVIAANENFNLKYKDMLDEVVGVTGLSPSTRTQVAQRKKDADLVLAHEVATHLPEQYKLEGVTKDGLLKITDLQTGETKDYDETMTDVLLASAYEVSGAVMGAKAGSDVGRAAGPYGTVVGGLLGGALGAAFGRGADTLRNAREANLKATTLDTLAKMNDAGIADITLGALGSSAIRLASGTWRVGASGLSRAYDLFVGGNKEGAQQTLKDVFNLNDAQVVHLVKQWEQVTGIKALTAEARDSGVLTGADSDTVMRVLTETIPGAENIVARATEGSKSGGAHLSAAIDKRAKDITKAASDLTNDNIDSVVQARLGQYSEATRDFFEQTKSIGVELMKDSPYRFDFTQTTLLPIMKNAAKGIHNSGLRRDFYHYMERIAELGGTSPQVIKVPAKDVSKEKLATAAAQRQELLKVTQSKRDALAKALAAKTRGLEAARALKTPAGRKARAAKVKEAYATKRNEIETQHLTKAEAVRASHIPPTAGEASTKVVPGQPSPYRAFENLLELRKTINELRGDTRFGSFTHSNQLKAALTSIDKEIAVAARTHMPKGDVWLKQWKASNTEYSKMKQLEHNVLYKALTSPRVDHDAAVSALTKSMMYTDPSTFMQVMGKLPVKTRKGVEGAVLKSLISKYTVGIEAGKQALNFPMLASDLEKMAFTQPDARDLKRTVREIAEVFKNDPFLQAVTGKIPLPKFQQALTDSLEGKARYAIASSVFNAIRARIPFDKNAGRAALVHNLGKILDNPRDAKTTKEILAALPDDPELKTAMHQLAIQFVEKGVPEHYGKVPIYRVAKPGDFQKASNTKIGTGVLYYTDKATAQRIAKETGTKVKEVFQLHKRIATPEDVTRALGHELSPEELKSDETLQLLKDRDFAGIAIDNKVLLFK